LLDRNDIPVKIANNDKVKNAVNQVITEPAKAIPDKTIASNVIKPTVVVPTFNQNKSNDTNTAAPNDNAGKNQVQESLASIDRHAVEFLPTRSAKEITTRSFVDPEFTFIRISQMYMNQNLEFYYNLKLNQELEYAEMYSKDKEPGKTIFNSIKGKVGDLLASNHNAPPKEEAKNVSLWTFAELGVKTFNTITSSDVELNLKKDDEGKVVGYDLEGNLINIERDLKK